MRRNRWAILVTVTVTVMAAVATVTSVGALAAALAQRGHRSPAEETLRDLGMRHGLWIGTAINNDALADSIEQASAAGYSALMQGCLAGRHCLSFTVWGFDDKHNWTSSWDFGSGKGTEALAAIYDAQYRPKRAVNTLRADLAFSGPPYVLARIPQHPCR